MLRELYAGDVDLDVRLAAARALGQTRDPAAMATLAIGLEDRDPAMQYRTVKALRQIAPQDLGDDVERWRQYLSGAAPHSQRD
jgi:HEAT repeat protein